MELKRPIKPNSAKILYDTAKPASFTVRQNSAAAKPCQFRNEQGMVMTENMHGQPTLRCWYLQDPKDRQAGL